MVILFDGVCNLCNGFVRFVLKRDKRRVFRFASLQSKYGTGLSAHFNLPVSEPETIVLYNKGRILTESDAVIKIASSFGGIWKCVSVLSFVPRFIRNGLYKFVSRNRYRIFGKRDQCMVPTPDVKERFMDEHIFLEIG